MTLNDLERPKRTLPSRRKDDSFGAHCKNLNNIVGRSSLTTSEMLYTYWRRDRNVWRMDIPEVDSVL